MQRRTAVGESTVLMAGKNRRVLIDQREGAAQDGRSRAPVLLQHNELCRRKMPMKQLERGARRPAEAIHRLVGISDGKYVPTPAGNAGENLHLREICVLKFVCKDEAGAGLCLRQNLFVL